MTEEQARVVAEALGGVVWQSGGGLHVVRISRPDGSLIVLTDECICEYSSEKAFEEGKPVTAISMT